MKKAILYVFSGTGNTKMVADEYRKNFKEFDIETTIYMISGNFSDAPNPNDYDIVGFGYPIHAFNAPQLVVNFAKSLPNAKDNNYTFIFKTSGEPLKLNDASSTKLMKVLKKKNYDISLERHIVMPYNMIFRHNDDMAKQLWVLARSLTKLHSEEVANGKREKVKYPMRRRLITYPFRIEWYGAKFNGKLYTVDPEKCIKCMKCVKVCPTKNIKYENGEFKFGNKCLMCVRCSFNCPTNAINIGLLNGWKVNGSYKLKQLEKDVNLNGNFINRDTKGVYKKIYKSYVISSEELLNTKETQKKEQLALPTTSELAGTSEKTKVLVNTDITDETKSVEPTETEIKE